MVRIRTVKVLDKFRVRLGLTDGKQKTVDLEPYLRGPIFEPLRNNPALFRTVKVDEELGTIVWANGADMDPDVLIEDLTPAWMNKLHHYPKNADPALALKEKRASYSSKKRKK